MNTLTFGTFSREVIGSPFCLKFCLMFKQYTRAGVRLHDALGDCLKGYSGGQHLCKFIGRKGKRLLKKRVQLRKDWFGTPTWPPFHCFGTPIWPT